MKIVQKATPSTDISQIIYGDIRPARIRYNPKPRVVRGIVQLSPFRAFGTIVEPLKSAKDLEPEYEQDESEADDYYDQLVETGNYIETVFEEEQPELPYNGVIADNEFVVDEAEADQVHDDIDVKDDTMRSVMRENLALVIGLDTASNYIEALSEDVIGQGVKVDAALMDALVPLTRLNTFVAAVGTLANIPDKYKDLLIRNLTRLTADAVFSEFKDGKRREGLQEMHNYYAATLARAGMPADENDMADVNTLGVRSSRRS